MMKMMIYSLALLVLLLPTTVKGFAIVGSTNKGSSSFVLYSSTLQQQASPALQINKYDGLKQNQQQQQSVQKSAPVVASSSSPSYRYGKYTDFPTSTVTTTGADTVLPSLTSYSPSYDNHRTDFIHHPFGHVDRANRYPITDSLMETRNTGLTTSNSFDAIYGPKPTGPRVMGNKSEAQLIDMNKIPKATNPVIPPGRISGGDAWWLGPEQKSSILTVSSANGYLSSYMKPNGKLSVSIHPPSHVDDDKKKK
jgi:hypothetical protein